MLHSEGAFYSEVWMGILKIRTFEPEKSGRNLKLTTRTWKSYERVKICVSVRPIYPVIWILTSEIAQFIVSSEQESEPDFRIAQSEQNYEEPRSALFEERPPQGTPSKIGVNLAKSDGNWRHFTSAILLIAKVGIQTNSFDFWS